MHGGLVYDATPFLAEHPGGAESILIVAGQVLKGGPQWSELFWWLLGGLAAAVAVWRCLLVSAAK